MIRISAAIDPARALRLVKVLHTAVWAFFASCILSIHAAISSGRLELAALLVMIVCVEVIVLAFNGWKCPLTAVAARFTDDRRDNFDIYLPVWLARHNKTIFGVLFVLGVVRVIAHWN